MAFDKVPSQLWSMFWTITYYDIQTRLRLFVGERQLMVNQQFQMMSQVVSLAFGGSSKEETSAAPKTGAEALAMFGTLRL